MTPQQIAAFAAQHVGKPVSLYNSRTRDAITGIIEQVDQVAGHLWVGRGGGGRTLTGLPAKSVTPQYRGGAVVFEYDEMIPGGPITYRPTIKT